MSVCCVRLFTLIIKDVEVIARDTPKYLWPVGDNLGLVLLSKGLYEITQLKRFALGDRDPLVYNPDGSLDVWIQASEPTGPAKSNWLPVKAEQDFSLNARLYWPKPAATDAQWRMPDVERLD